MSFSLSVGLPVDGFVLFEKVVYNQLYDYFTKKKLFHDNQYGFKTKHSIELTVTELIDRVLLNIDNKQVPFAVFIDLSTLTTKSLATLDGEIVDTKIAVKYTMYKPNIYTIW